MKFIYILAICFFCLFSATMVPAQYYQYLDKDGIKHYTDDITDIPEDIRSRLTIYQSIQPVTKKTLQRINPAITPESLVIKKDNLDKEYEILVTKRKKLNKQKKALGEKKYNELASQLNIEIKQYQEKTNAYEKLVEQYNRQVTSGKKK